MRCVCVDSLLSIKCGRFSHSNAMAFLPVINIHIKSTVQLIDINNTNWNFDHYSAYEQTYRAYSHQSKLINQILRMKKKNNDEPKIHTRRVSFLFVLGTFKWKRLIRLEYL